MNVIATMTAGSDTCPKLDMSRIRFVVAGVDQKSDPRPAFCGTSSRVKTNERAGQSITADDADATPRRRGGFWPFVFGVIVGAAALFALADGLVPGT